MVSHQRERHQDSSELLREVHFTFHRGRDTIVDENTIIAATLEKIQAVNPDEILIDTIDRRWTPDSIELEHRVVFECPVVNPGLPVQDGVTCGRSSRLRDQSDERRSDTSNNNETGDVVRSVSRVIDTLASGAACVMSAGAAAVGGYGFMYSSSPIVGCGSAVGMCLAGGAAVVFGAQAYLRFKGFDPPQSRTR